MATSPEVALINNQAEIIFFFFNAKSIFIRLHPYNVYISATSPPVYTIQGIKREIKFYPTEYNTNTKLYFYFQGKLCIVIYL